MKIYSFNFITVISLDEPTLNSRDNVKKLFSRQLFEL